MTPIYHRIFGCNLGLMPGLRLAVGDKQAEVALFLELSDTYGIYNAFLNTLKFLSKVLEVYT